MGARLIPRVGRVVRVVEEAPLVRTYHIRVGGIAEPEPGQFNVLYIKGFGEVVISVSDYSRVDGDLVVEHTVRAVGAVTSYMHSNVDEGSLVGVRGPYGRGWPLKEFEGFNILIVGGGIGLAPLRPVLKYFSRHRDRYGRLVLLYGARRPVDMLYKYEYGEYRAIPNSSVHFSIDMPYVGWDGYVGFVTDLIDRVDLDPATSVAYVCGPEIMMKVAAAKLVKRGFREDRVFLSLERRCRCGIGICGTCQLGHLFVCKDGPVFSYQEVKGYISVSGL